MALDFPTNPTNGQIYGSYTYNSTVGAWQSREDSRTVAILSSTVPASANPGDIWVNTNDGISFVYYDDGTSSQWMELLPSGVPLLDTKADIAGDTFTGNVTAPRFISNIATGTAPFGVTSTTVVTNLNADLLDGNHSTAFSPVAGSASITTVGTIGTGTWNGSTIAVSNGGTGVTTLTGYAKGSGTSNFSGIATIPVADGGTGATTLTSGAYLKGAGTSAITSQSGIPAGDITSGTLAYARMPAGSVIQVKTVRYQGRPVWTFNNDSYITYLNVAITPRFSTSLLICDFMVTGEVEYNAVFRSARDGALISQAGYEGYNTEDTNIWSGISPVPYDGDLASTPFSHFVRYFAPANNTNATTMQLAVRPTVSGATGTFALNRTFNSTGASAYEIGVSYATVWEIAQ